MPPCREDACIDELRESIRGMGGRVEHVTALRWDEDEGRLAMCGDNAY